MLWWIISTLFAFFVKGLCGFANTLVFTTLLSFENSNLNISPIELLLGYPTNAILAWKDRKHINWRICLPLTLLVIGGSIPGILFLKNTEAGILKIFFGIIIILIALEMVLRDFQKQKLKQSSLVLGIIGVLSGLLCGLYGIGALLGAYINRVTTDSHSFKANLCFVFLIENTIRIILYTLSGIISLHTLWQAVPLFPFMFLGLFLGIQSSKIIDDKVVKKLVLVLLLFSGAALIINNLSAFL